MDSKAPVPEPTDLTSRATSLARTTLSPLSTLTLVATLGTLLMGPRVVQRASPIE